jgi:hypothetical protein
MPHGVRPGEGAQGQQPRSNRPRRDEVREQRILAEATGAVDGGDWNRQVASRLAQGQRDYGDAWVYRPAADLVVEATEEAADLAAWLLLAEQAIDAEDLADAGLIRCLLSLAMGRAAQAHVELAAALALLGDPGSSR